MTKQLLLRMLKDKLIKYVKAHFTKQVWGALWLWTKQQNRTLNGNSHIPARGHCSPQECHGSTPGRNFQLFTANLRLFSAHVNTSAEKAAEYLGKKAFLYLPVQKCYFTFRSWRVWGHTSNSQCDRDKGNALVSHVVCFWEPALCGIHSGEITFLLWFN